MSMAGDDTLNVPSYRNAGSISNIRRSDGTPQPPANRSNSRSISLRRDRHASGVLAGAGGVFITSAGVVALTVSFLIFIYFWQAHHAREGDVQTLIQINWTETPQVDRK